MFIKVIIIKKTIKTLLLASLFIAIGCKQNEQTSSEPASESTEVQSGGQENVVDETSVPNIVQTAVGSKDHTTLVAAVKAAGLVTSLSNAGPFTVFAPTNAAFDKLPAGTVDGLLKPEKKSDLENILGYHTYVGTLKIEYMNDGQEFDMVYGGKVKITKKNDKTYVNGSEIVATIETGNGIIHVIGDVLLPK
ncbi:fasciclin domain-containing protein [Flavobacterium psychrophilum]|uniref:fasciclin domain-containing protein n=1 Tax=Flavobacterium psychrophilum TaxID=96345 RepID=UPI001D07FACD|nr:fasciclin domain-containing protein [Flavobacterium psychrophilum]MCB6099392.1 fasciclin domain-containing protein [Flavobacterium psychrophilum]